MKQKIELDTKTRKEGNNIIVTTTRTSTLNVAEATKELEAVNSAIERAETQLKQLGNEVKIQKKALKKLGVPARTIKAYRRYTQAINHEDQLEGFNTQIESLTNDLARFRKTGEDLRRMLE